MPERDSSLESARTEPSSSLRKGRGDMQQLELKIGPDVITSYKRLAYTPWHALAEFVDNSTQAYFNNRKQLDALLKKEQDRLTVSIAYDRGDDLLRIADNSSGMDYDELETALHVGHR